MLGYEFGLCQEVYIYDAETGQLASRRVTERRRPTGSSVVPLTQFQRLAFEPLSRALFDSGRLFFDSADALVPQDTNGNTDVYEFEPRVSATVRRRVPRSTPRQVAVSG